MLDLTKNNLTRAAWLLIISSIVSVPFTIKVFIKAFSGDMSVSLLDTSVVIITSLVYIYTYFLFKQLLNERFRLHSLDKFIYLWIVATIISILFQIIQFLSNNLTNIIGIASILILIVLGISLLIFGMKLRKAKIDLYGLKNSYANISIVSGVIAVTIILLPLLVILGPIADIMSAVILLRAAKNLSKK